MAYTVDPGARAAMRAIEIQQLKKATEHLIGICDGIVADNHVNETEVLYLRNWLSNHEEVTQDWPGCVIAQRVDAILADGIITADERFGLLETLREFTGNHFLETGTAAPDGPILPIDDDPSIFFRDMSFCLTGRFLWGTRAACERVIMNLGGTVVDTVTQRLNYLVIGALVEQQWAHTTFGRKIETAIQRIQAGGEIVIVSEQQWTEALQDATR